ncbi:MAG: phosphatidate cytidylyltransferase [Alphaproteobacteria bacterium]|nr:phosphatidate cytidylyltransferase [Alphaproteobacteria bacterium]
MADAPIKFEGLLQRVRSALILLPFVIAPVVFGGWSFTLLLAIAGFLMAREWANLVAASSDNGRILGLTVVAVLGFGFWVGAMDAVALIIVASLVAATFALVKGRRLGPLVGGLYYVGLPLVVAQYLRQDALGEFLIGYILVSVWAVDIFAMFAGKIIGGPKLAPVISPKKTWAGLLGGMVGAALAGILSFLTVVGFGFGEMQFASILIIAPLLAIIAQAADLFESAIKRRFNVKDSGAIIPGHGGLLDRVDGLIGVLIVAYAIVLWRGGASSTALWIW